MNQTPRALPARLPHGDDGTENESPASRLLSPRSAKARRYPCPYCGSEESSTTNLWRHKAAKCEKNPNPACDYCGWRYKPAELERHMQRCDYRDNPRERTRADPDDAGTPDADESKKTAARSSRTPPPRAPEQADPEEDVTPEDAQSQRARRPGRLRGAARRLALLATRPGKPPHPPVHLPLDPILATLALNAQELTRGLVVASLGKLAQPREPSPLVTLAPATPRDRTLVRAGQGVTENLTAALNRLHERGLIPPPRSVHEDPWDRFLDTAEEKLSPDDMDALLDETSEWPTLTKTIIGLTCQPPSEEVRPEVKLGNALLGAGIFAGGWLLWKIFTQPEPSQAAPSAAPITPPAPQYRPPYNSGRWASLEHYLAEVGHLPTAQDAGEETRLGLDRSSTAAPASTSFATTADEERARKERERERPGVGL